jgi:hypothetical protein
MIVELVADAVLVCARVWLYWAETSGASFSNCVLWFHSELTYLILVGTFGFYVGEVVLL